MITYTVKDQLGNAVTLTPGVAFTTYDRGIPIQHAPNALALFTDADLAAFGITTTAEPDAPAVPALISRMQAELELQATPSPVTPGKTLLDDVNAAIAGATDPTLTIYWNTAADFHRDHPKLNAIAAAMGLSSAQVDALFIAAAQLS